ncbi:MAG: hypothetical protein IT462_09940 [Planctomycetes bacterium]|nr:hypothetical protein [Planctomycetota bacterium]
MKTQNSPACERGLSHQVSQSVISERTPRHYWRGCHAAFAALLLLSACAAPDPYKRAIPPAISPIPAEFLVQKFNNRWPGSFKCTQTVILDFGPVTKTFVGYLAVDHTPADGAEPRVARFRLQGMTEQGVKMFDLAHNERDGDIVVLAPSDEIKGEALKSISRDIQRVFLLELSGEVEAKQEGNYDLVCRRTSTPAIHARGFLYDSSSDPSSPPLFRPRRNRFWLDSMMVTDDRGPLFSLDQFEPQKFAGPEYLPSTIVLRDSGRGSFPYKLTVRITDFKVVEKPFPEKTFFPNG